MAPKTLQDLAQDQRPRSEGAVALARTGLTQAEIGARLDVSESLVSHWIPGRRIPTMPHRRAMQVAFAIPIASWDEPATAFAIPSPPPSDTRLTAERIDALALRMYHTAEFLLDQVQKCDTPASSLKLARQATATLKEAANLAGVGVTMTQARLLRTPACRALLSQIRAALRPFPEALDAVEAELDED